MLVNITFTQKMKFQKQVEIDEAEFIELKDLNNESFTDRVSSYHLVQGYFTPHDIFDDINEIEDFYIEKVNEKEVKNV